MRLEKNFEVDRLPDFASRVASRDETLLSLFADAKTEIVEREGNRRTTRTHYRALGREGVATFHFHSLPDGRISFEKICDGNVWQELSGTVSFKKTWPWNPGYAEDDRPDEGARSRVRDPRANARSDRADGVVTASVHRGRRS